jgi:hypothetical protein
LRFCLFPCIEEYIIELKRHVLILKKFALPKMYIWSGCPKDIICIELATMSCTSFIVIEYFSVLLNRLLFGILLNLFLGSVSRSRV